MNNAEVLCHSSGPWKKHKYFQKIGEGANAVYRYAKNDAANDAKQFYNKNITGDEYKGRELAAKENSAYDKHLAENAVKEGRLEAANRLIKSSERYGKKAAQAEHDYRTKSLKGMSERAVEKAGKTASNAKHTIRSVANDSVSRGQRLIDKLFGKETEKKTITDTKTGKQRTPSKPKSKSDTINIKELSKKNKK